MLVAHYLGVHINEYAYAHFALLNMVLLIGMGKEASVDDIVVVNHSQPSEVNLDFPNQSKGFCDLHT